MILIENIDRCSDMLLSFQRQYFTIQRYNQGMKPSIEEFLRFHPETKPHDEQLLAIYYFENWTQLKVLIKKRPSEMKKWVRKWLERMQTEKIKTLN